MGLKSLPEHGWLANESEDEALLRERRRILDERRDEVVGWMPGSEASIQELGERIQAWQVRFGGESAEAPPKPGIEAGAGEWLEWLGRFVAEDLCLIDAASEAPPRLTAGVVCFPNRWRLAEQLGRGMDRVHAPVPDYAEKLADPVDRFLRTLATDQAFGRLNWSLLASPAWFQPETLAAKPGAVTPWLRLEWQTFCRLPRSRAILFAIRTHQTPWRSLPQASREALLGQIRTLSPAWMAYKGLDRIESSLREPAAPIGA
jgi:hypothetical protein